MEYRDGSFVPSVANDAVKVIQRLTTALKATQAWAAVDYHAAYGGGQQVRRPSRGFSIWGHDQDDRALRRMRPPDGTGDSHRVPHEPDREARNSKRGTRHEQADFC